MGGPGSDELSPRTVTFIGSPTNDLFAGGGEMGNLMRSTCWSETRLGPVENWPQSLKTMLGVVLGSRFPMLLWWGPDLLHLYNDAYRPILRDKHPASLAAPAAEVWAEVWKVAGPMAKGVQAGGPATWTEDLQLFIKSGDMAEETYFTFSYSPVPGDDGRVGGVLNTVQETTVKVQSEREIRMLHDLAAGATKAKSEDEAYRIAAEILSSNDLDLPFTLLYRVNETADQARLVALSGWPEDRGNTEPTLTPILGDTHGKSGAWQLDELLRTPHDAILDDLSSRFGPMPMGRGHARPERAIILPLSRVGQPTPYAFLVAGVSPHRRLDERYRRFFRATADQVANVVTHAHAYEAETHRAEALAEIDRTKTTFFNNVSHEFRTPLTLILGHVEDALAEPAKALNDDGLQSVHRNALRLLRLVNSLLDFARIEAGRLQPSFVPTDLSVLTTDLVSSFRSLIERAGLTLRIDCPPLASPIYVDPALWEKIVLNLISNAFKFTLRGEIAVRLCTQGDRVELDVRDSGCGIPSSELPHIFERFHRIEATRGRSFEGTGIGLSLVLELVKLHGGSVGVSSLPGEGSTFTVSLPTGHAHLPMERIFERTSSSTETSTAPYLLEASQWIDSTLTWHPSVAPAGDKRSRERARILVVDDNADMRDYLVRLLAPRWHVEVAEDGQAALAKACDQPPDLVLSDVMMPRLDGFGLLHELRRHPLTCHVPVVLLSARAGEDAVVQGIETGADDYLVKPFSARELLARVQTHLELARLRRAWSSELERANQELEAFSYSVSHDLRAPLRAIDGFSNALLNEYASHLDPQARHYLHRVRAGTQRMAQLIDDLLNLSRITRASLRRQPLDLTDLARKILLELEAQAPERKMEIHVADGLAAHADPRLVRAMLENLLGNAWKFTSKRPFGRIEVGKDERDTETVFFIRDNGAGFDMEYAKRLFVAFQRLHTEAEFEGTGIGLATVYRIVARHDGRIWAESVLGQGATFFFTLGGEV